MAERTAVSDREQVVLDRIETRAREAGAVPRPADHHGPRRGRPGEPDADRGPAGARPRRAGPGRARRRGALSVGGVELALTTDSFVVTPIRFPGGSIGELAVNGTVNDLAVAGRAPAGAHAVARAGGGPGRRGPPGRGRRDRRGRGRGRRGGRGRRHEGRRARPRATRMYVTHDRASGSVDPRAEPVTGRAAAGRPDPRVRAGRRATAWRSCSRAASSSSTRTIESDTRSLWPMVDAMLDAAGPGAALPARRDAGRRRRRC